MPVRTSAAFYRRGVPNSFKDFGLIATGNYTVINPTSSFVKNSFFSKGMSNIIYNK